MVKLMLDNGADVESLATIPHQGYRAISVSSKGPWKANALQLACEQNDTIIVKMLLNHGAKVSAPASSKASTLDYAISFGTPVNLQLLLNEGNDISAHEVGEVGWLERSGDDTGIVRILFEHATSGQLSDPSIRRKLLTRAAWLAAPGTDTQLLQKILKDDVDRDARDKSGNTLLSVAAYFKDLAVMRVLVEQGADINAQNNNGTSALHHSAYRDNLEAAKFLLENGADVNCLGQCPISWIRGSEMYDTVLAIAAARGLPNLVKLLLQHNADVNSASQNSQGCSALEAAVHGGNGKVVQALIDAGAGVLSDGVHEDMWRKAISVASRDKHPSEILGILQKGYKDALQNCSERRAKG